MRFSVVVAFLNEERYLERCLSALRDQTVPQSGYEVIFVDNGSIDDSADIVRRHGDVRLLRQTEVPRNVYATRNRGLEIATGRIVAFTDADCAPRRDWLAQIESGMQRTGAGLVLGHRRFAAGASWALRVFEGYENTKARYVVEPGQQRFLFGYGNNMAVRREVFDRIGPLAALPLSGDTELVQRYAEMLPGEPVAFLNDMVVEHLEVRTVSDWLRKLRTYGAHNRQVTELRPRYRNLSLRAKSEILRRCAADQPSRALALVGLLALGDLCYVLGKMKRRDPPPDALAERPGRTEPRAAPPHAPRAE